MLDTFRSVVQNVSTELDAWLTFLGSDQPADLVRLVKAYPQFQEYYQDILDFRRHPKELIGMFSEALTIMDRNTALYMCEEWKKEAKELREQLHSVISEKDSVISEKDSLLSEKDSVISEKNSLLSEKDSHIAALKEEIRRLKQNK